MLVSCDKYLDVVPVGKVIPQTVAELEEELNFAYATINYDKGLSSYRGDEFEAIEDREDKVELIQNHFTWNENGQFNSASLLWKNEYFIIFSANHVIEAGAAATDGSGERRNQLVGEAYLLRAYTYFTLVNLYGKPFNSHTSDKDKAVPLITSIDMEKVSPRNSVGEVYAQILKDIEAGLGLLNVNQFELKKRYRFTTVSANALAARVHLYMGNWQKAAEYARLVIQANGSLTDLRSKDASLPNLYNSEECIQSIDLIYGNQMLDAVKLSGTLKDKYDAQNDLRFAKFFDHQGTDYVIKKIEPANSKYRCSFRTAEFYLIMAEALAHLGDLQESVSYLNQLKEKRYSVSSFPLEKARVNAMTAVSLLNEIADERARELAFEGHRWFDLRRTTQPEIVHKLNQKHYVLKRNDDRYTILIPQDAIDNNPLLKK